MIEPVATLALDPQRGNPVATLPCALDRFLKTTALICMYFATIDDHVDAHATVGDLARFHVVDGAHRSANDEAPVALASQFVAKLEKFLCTTLLEFMTYEDALALELRGEALCGLGGDGGNGVNATRWAVGHALVREEPGEVGLKVRHRRDGRSNRLHRSLAIDGDSGGDGIEFVERRSLQSLEKLPRVGAEALDEATLPFRVQRVEGERRFPRAARPRQRNPGPGLQVEVDATEVVRASAAKPKGVHGFESLRHARFAERDDRGMPPRAPPLRRNHGAQQNWESRMTVRSRHAGSVMFAQHCAGNVAQSGFELPPPVLASGPGLTPPPES